MSVSSLPSLPDRSVPLEDGGVSSGPVTRRSMYANSTPRDGYEYSPRSFAGGSDDIELRDPGSDSAGSGDSDVVFTDLFADAGCELSYGRAPPPESASIGDSQSTDPLAGMGINEQLRVLLRVPNGLELDARTEAEGILQGSGTAQWPDGSIYTGEFHDGNVWGQGRYEWPREDAVYDGQVANGLRHGQGTLNGGFIEYNGDWRHGKRHGHGTCWYTSDKSSSLYEGEWQHHRKHGKGVMLYVTGNTYDGDWVDGKRHGHGTMLWKSAQQRYTGEWKDGQQHGHGEHIWLHAHGQKTMYFYHNRYVGQWEHGKRNGIGTFYYADGGEYHGGWRNNLKHGHGRMLFDDGRVYDGEWIDDKPADAKALPPPIADSLLLHRTTGATPGHARSALCDAGAPDPRLPAAANAETPCDMLLRRISDLRRIYRAYSSWKLFRCEHSALTRMEFWKMCVEARISSLSLPLAEIDRVIARAADQCALKPEEIRASPHNPHQTMTFREFNSALVAVARALYPKEATPGLSTHRLINDHVVHVAQNDTDPRMVAYSIDYMPLVMRYRPTLEHVYAMYAQRQADSLSSCDRVMTVRHVVLFLSDCELLSPDALSVQQVASIFRSMMNNTPCDPEAGEDVTYGMDWEIVFLEFVHGMVECAKVFKATPSTPKLPCGDDAASDSRKDSECLSLFLDLVQDRVALALYQHDQATGAAEAADDAVRSTSVAAQLVNEPMSTQ